MPDKISDNDIKKALECCINWKREGDCAKCPLYQNDAFCLKSLRVSSLDLINRLEAENERLKNDLAISEKETKRYVQGYKMACSERNEFLGQLETAKAEAYKELADKIHTEIHQALDSNYKARAERIERLNVGETDEFISYCQGKIDALRGIDDFVDETYKEMVGEDNA